MAKIGYIQYGITTPSAVLAIELSYDVGVPPLHSALIAHAPLPGNCLSF